MDRQIHDRILGRLAILYGAERAPAIFDELMTHVIRAPGVWPKPVPRWSERDALLITYGDSVLDGKTPPLQALHTFLKYAVGDAINHVHILPFFPYTSDDGFSVVDFRRIRDDLGDWDDIEKMAQDYRIAFDCVLNHVSQESDYVRGYCSGDPKYRDFCIAMNPDRDLSQVVRPRTLPLLHKFATHDGSKWLWTTFSRDQVDLNYGNPQVLLEMLDVLMFYAARGASMIRLDAIPFLWKQVGTGCSHLPQVHQVVKLIRDVYDLKAPHVCLLSETNVPHNENIKYFGNQGDEAQMIYNFTLAPLILWSLLKGNCRYLSEWSRCVHNVSERATFLNVTATHDGIGVRPTENILTPAERQELGDSVRRHGGRVSYKSLPDGDKAPYELNITYFDALNDPMANEPVALQVSRMLCSQAIAIAFLGIPGIYIHSLVGSRNYQEGVETTGAPRSINRERLHLAQLRRELAQPDHRRAMVLGGMRTLLQARAQHSAFSPLGTQEVIDCGETVFALLRHNPNTGESVLALHNVTDKQHNVCPEKGMPVPWHDILSGDRGDAAEIPMEPYQVRWLAIPPVTAHVT